MDPFSGTASAIAILQLSGTIIASCYNYFSRLKSATKDAKKIINELNSLRTVIESLLDILDEEDDAGLSKSILEKLAQENGSLNRCQTDLEELSRKLEPQQGWRHVKAVAMWPLKESDTQKVLSNIQDTKSTIQLALALDHRKGLSSLLSSVQSLQQTITSTAKNTLREEILKWLGNTDSISSHLGAQKKRQSETGLWLLQSSQFNQWYRNPQSWLWVHGITGSGKTVICSTIIDEIQRRIGKDPERILAYYYFDFQDRERDCQAFLKSILFQLAVQQSAIPNSLHAFYDKHRQKRQLLSIDLLNIIASIAKELENVYIVADALDECTDRQDILDVIEEINGASLKNIHIILTSRPNPEIESSLSAFLTHQISLDQKHVDADIALYVRDVLEKDQKLSRWPSSVRQQIREKLETGSCGMFRWVVCQFDTLRQCLTVSDVTKELEILPKSLTKTYEMVLLRIPDAYRNSAHRLLQWLAFSGRPTRIHEAAEMLAVDLDKQIYDPNQRLLNAEDIMLLCSSLLARGIAMDDYVFKDPTMNLQYREEEISITQPNNSWIVQLAHFSVKDYIVANTTKTGPTGFFFVNPRQSHLVMMETCLIYLSQPSFDYGYSDHKQRLERFREWPLYHYAAFFWLYHCNRIGDDFPDRSWSLLERFFETRNVPGGGNFVAWICTLFPNLDIERAGESEPLYYAASFGILPLVKKLCSLGVNVEAPGGRFRSTAVHVAVYRRQIDVVRFLLEEHVPPANINARNSIGEMCLSWAEDNDDQEMRNLLKKHGAKESPKRSSTRKLHFNRKA